MSCAIGKPPVLDRYNCPMWKGIAVASICFIVLLLGLVIFEPSPQDAALADLGAAERILDQVRTSETPAKFEEARKAIRVDRAGCYVAMAGADPARESDMPPMPIPSGFDSYKALEGRSGPGLLNPSPVRCSGAGATPETISRTGEWQAP